MSGCKAFWEKVKGNGHVMFRKQYLPAIAAFARAQGSEENTPTAVPSLTGQKILGFALD
jgi:hypothetical protein